MWPLRAGGQFLCDQFSRQIKGNGDYVVVFICINIFFPGLHSIGLTGVGGTQLQGVMVPKILLCYSKVHFNKGRKCLYI